MAVGEWKDETNLTTVEALHNDLSYTPSSYHDPAFAEQEQEILQHYKDWAYFANFKFKVDPDQGHNFYDLDDVLYYDLMGVVTRGSFGAHFDRIGPYFANAHIAFKDLEVYATSPTSGWSSMVQRYWGKSTDGVDFDFTFRITGILQKKDGGWRFVHEHVSFPVDMKTQKADFSCGLEASVALYIGKDRDQAEKDGKAY
ncbi:hypothetical protein EDB80DRAFT_771831 [Ilyonectria destructans]|nr:hypothetical protein EDB80DRAFT_771831 [Ilyonectria destructans]